MTIGELDGRFSHDGRRVTLLAHMLFISTDGNVVVDVPAGHISDFNSVPRALWRLFAPWEFPRAGVIHDRMYETGQYVRGVSDDVHRDILIHDGMPKWKAIAARQVLRVAGWVAWNRYRREAQERLKFDQVLAGLQQKAQRRKVGKDVSRP
jgi:hypothetical protein